MNSGQDTPRKRRATRRNTKARKVQRLERGAQTPIEDYYEPVLRALITLSGKGTVKQVVGLVESAMWSEFNEFDLERIASSKISRWEKRVNFARYRMMENGLIADSSERGVWEITEKGKKWLAERK